ncbi:MAG: DUF3180 domain-containing protein [Actinomycetota bacterium]
MRRTAVADLLAAFVVVGVLVFLLLRLTYDSVPPLQYPIVIPIAALGVAELVAARRVRGAVRHEPDAKPMAAIVIARCVALGKASALVGAAVAGGAAAVIVKVAPSARTVRIAGNDLRVAIALLTAAALITVAGLLLERAGVDPGNTAEQLRHEVEQ